MSWLPGREEMRCVKFADISDTALLTARDSHAHYKKKRLYASFIADDKKVVIYVYHDDLVGITRKKDQSR